MYEINFLVEVKEDENIGMFSVFILYYGFIGV